MKKLTILWAGIFLMFFTANVSAVPINWTDWTSYSASHAEGKLGSIGIKYYGRLEFAQFGTNYWTEGTPAPYTGNPIVDNAPPASEMLALNIATKNKITFSHSVANPLMAIVSLGRPDLPVTYDFDTPFKVLSEGEGYWGDGTYTIAAGDNILTGYELHAAIQFLGYLSEINWDSTSEYWHGFTFGLADYQSVPEPATILLVGIGLVGLAGLRRKLKSNTC